MIKSRRVSNPTRTGSFVAVGAGISLVGQVTLDAKQEIRNADRVFYVVNSSPAVQWIRRLNKRAESLEDCYQVGRLRVDSYRMMVKRIAKAVHDGERVCGVFYGHPGVLAQAPHAVIRLLRREGLPARMLPGISADACLFADAGINPGDFGCQSFEAIDFLCYQRRFDPCSSLIIWQLGVLGEVGFRPGVAPDPVLLADLVKRLTKSYSSSHRVLLYRASTLPIEPVYLQWTSVRRLMVERISPNMLLYVPPLKNRPPSNRVLRALKNSSR